MSLVPSDHPFFPQQTRQGKPPHKQRETAYLQFMFGSLAMIFSLLFYLILGFSASKIIAVVGMCICVVFIVISLWWAIGCYTNKEKAPHAAPVMCWARRIFCIVFGLLVLIDLVAAIWFLIGVAKDSSSLTEAVGFLGMFAFALLPFGAVRFMSIIGFVAAFFLTWGAEKTLAQIPAQTNLEKDTKNVAA